MPPPPRSATVPPRPPTKSITPLPHPPSHQPPLPPPPPAPPSSQPQEGDALWLRVMDTKENQWRFINTVALHQLSIQERKACDELTALSARLQSLEATVDATDRLVRHCRAKRLHQQLHRIAAAPLRRATSNLSNLDYPALANAVIDANLSAPVPARANDIVDEVDRFNIAADRFREAASAAGLDHLVKSSDAMEQLAAITAIEAGVVVDSASQVTRAADCSEIARSSLLANLSTTTTSPDSLTSQPYSDN